MAEFINPLTEPFPDKLRHGALTLGNFDGVHRGHQALLAETMRQAKRVAGPSVAITFDPSPTQLLRPESYQPLLTPIPQRVALMEQVGIDHVVVLRTTRELLRLRADEFFQSILIVGLRVRAIVEGYNFAFGRDRQGTGEVLTVLGKQADIGVTMLTAQEIAGAPVSSSRVRTELVAGNLAEVTAMLGRPYRLIGTVVVGQKRGRTLGFPTANLDALNLTPGNGVYAVRVLHEGRALLGAANVGPNPTFGEQGRKVEVHLLDFQGDLYGQTLEVDFVAKIREIRSFHAIDELSRQIYDDVAQARRLAMRSHEMDGI